MMPSRMAYFGLFVRSSRTLVVAMMAGESLFGRWIVMFNAACMSVGRRDVNATAGSGWKRVER
jgi:hypothetical protein